MSQSTVSLRRSEEYMEGGVIIDHHPSQEILGGHIIPTFYGPFALRQVPFSFRVDPDSFIGDVLKIPLVQRLLGIHQLQWLTWLRLEPGIAPRREKSHRFKHNRLVHSLWSVVFRALVNQILGITGPQALLGLLVELVHDFFTPAYGDILKVIAPHLFDEDDLIEGLFETDSAWKDLCDKHDLPPEALSTIFDALHGKGVDGQIHELLDTLSYVLNDLDGLHGAWERLGEHVPTYFGEAICSPIRAALSIWQKVALKDGRVFITDPVALRDFLLLRVELWRNIYCNPANKVLELLYRQVIIPTVFLRQDRLTRQDLLSHDDAWLAAFIKQETGFVGLETLTPQGGPPFQIQFFEIWDAGREAECAAAARGIFTVLTSTAGDQPIKPKLCFNAIGESGLIQPFREAYPALAQEVIDRAATPACPPIHLITLEHPERVFSPVMMEQWRQIRKTWDEERFYGSHHLG